MNQENWKQAAERMFTPDELARWKGAAAQMPGGAPAYLARIEALRAKIVARLPLDPASAEAQALLDEWVAITRPLSDAATPEMRAKAIQVRKEMAGWEEDRQPPVNATVWEFIKAAARARRAH
ncbi:MAG: hypothetical protein WDN44_06600 [Sphingomonas sp.]